MQSPILPDFVRTNIRFQSTISDIQPTRVGILKNNAVYDKNDNFFFRIYVRYQSSLSDFKATRVGTKISMVYIKTEAKYT